eukprot:7068087-Pyramimonas_sp.AAC.1
MVQFEDDAFVLQPNEARLARVNIRLTNFCADTVFKEAPKAPRPWQRAARRCKYRRPAAQWM